MAVLLSAVVALALAPAAAPLTTKPRLWYAIIPALIPIFTPAAIIS